MKKITFILFTLWAAAGAMAGGTAWVTSLPEAVEQARNENKLLLLDFTGSDWCGWCMKLDEEVFSRWEFMNYARKNLVMVQVDFPMHKSQSDDLKKANRALAKKYHATGYPTVVIIKPDGRIMWSQEGYEQSSPGAMIDTVNRCRKAAGMGEPPQLAAPAPAPAPAKLAAAIPVAPVPPPAPPPQKPGNEPKLQGILYSASHSSVVLDGRVCEEGHAVNGMRVVKITQDQVTVEYLGQIKVLKMMESQDQIAVKRVN